MYRQRGPRVLPVAVLAAGFFVLAAAPAAADADDDDSIDQIVVVAHKDERSIRDVAAQVTVVSDAALKEQLAVSLDDVFRYVPGIDYEASGTRFGAEGVSIRGIGGNRVAILVDGVPLSDQFDVGSFSNATRDFLDTGLIRDVEVLHGPASALYGSAAIGGVVAVRTPDPRNVAGSSGIGGDALVTWRDSDDSAHGQATVAAVNGSLGALFAASKRAGNETDANAAPSGIDTRDYDRDTLFLKFVADDSRGNTWRASLTEQRARTRSDLNAMLGQGRFRSTTALEGDDRYDMRVVNLACDFGAPGGFVDAGVVRAYSVAADVSQATLDERGNARTPVSIERFFSFEQDISGLEFNLWKELGGTAASHRLGVGAEYRKRRSEEYRDGLSTDLSSGAQTNVLLGEVFPLRDFPISDTIETAAYIEDTISYGSWTLIAALRADRYELRPEQDPMYLDDYPFAELVTIDESELSPKFGVIWNATSTLDLYAQYSHGFRAPPFEDANIGLEMPLFNYRAIPNPDLRSESSDGVELGLRLLDGGSSARLSLFRTRYRDFIESKVRLGEDPVSGRILFQSQNLRATTIEGVEAAFARRFGVGERFGFDATLYYARGENDDTGEPLNSVGPPQAIVGLSWRSVDDRTSVALKATFAAAWDDRDLSGGALFEPPGYGVLDLLLARQVTDAVLVRARIGNLTDRTYWHWSDVRGLAPDDPTIPFLSRAGRSASLSLNLTW